MSKFLHAGLGLMLATLAGGEVRADTRDAELIGAFQQLCMNGQPNVATIESKARLAQLTTGQKDSQPSGQGGTINSRTWQGTLASGPYELIGSDTVDSRGHLISCAISAPDANGASFNQDLVAALQLGQPSSSSKDPSGNMLMTTWRAAGDPNLVLQLIQSSSGATPGVMLSYVGKQ